MRSPVGIVPWEKYATISGVIQLVKPLLNLRTLEACESARTAYHRLHFGTRMDNAQYGANTPSS